MKIRALLVDLGKVILLLDDTLAFRKLAALSPLKLTLEEIKQLLHAPDAALALESGTLSEIEFLRLMRERLQLSNDISNNELIAIWTDIFTPNQVVLDLLKRIDDDLILVLSSNTNAMHARYFSRAIGPVLALFDHHVLSFEIKYLKPDPGFFHQCVAVAGCQPEECLFIDDNSDYVAAAQRDCHIPGIVYDHTTTDLEAELQARGVNLKPRA